jgi:hypothetical protein
MPRLNYGHGSGVIIDVCRDHGIWFDADELARILAWLHAGGGRPPSSKKPRPAPSAETDARDVEPTPPSFLDRLLGVLLGSPDR